AQVRPGARPRPGWRGPAARRGPHTAPDRRARACSEVPSLEDEGADRRSHALARRPRGHRAPMMASEALAPAAVRYRRSREQLERARRSLAGGVATAMRSAQLPVPLVIDRGEGSHLVDIDGNEYVDYVLGFGPMLLGHTPAAVIEAVKAQL